MDHYPEVDCLPARTGLSHGGRRPSRAQQRHAEKGRHPLRRPLHQRGVRVRDEVALAAANIALSVVLCLAAVWLGYVAAASLNQLKGA